jgi:hypothetical protein
MFLQSISLSIQTPYYASVHTDRTLDELIIASCLAETRPSGVDVPERRQTLNGFWRVFQPNLQASPVAGLSNVYPSDSWLAQTTASQRWMPLR